MQKINTTSERQFKTKVSKFLENNNTVVLMEGVRSTVTIIKNVDRYNIYSSLPITGIIAHENYNLQNALEYCWGFMNNRTNEVKIK